MPYPPFADIETNYTAFQQGQGDNSFPGSQVDVDLANLKEAFDELNTFVRGITRSDGQIGNRTVGLDQLKQDLKVGFVPLGEFFEFATIGALLAVDPASSPSGEPLVDGQLAYVREYHSGTGHGGGYLQWDAASTEDADNGLIFGTGTGRWKRIEAANNGPLRVDMWGVGLDGAGDIAAVKGAFRALFTTEADTLYGYGITIRPDQMIELGNADMDIGNGLVDRDKFIEGLNIRPVEGSWGAGDAAFYIHGDDSIALLRSVIFTNCRFDGRMLADYAFKCSGYYHLQVVNCSIRDALVAPFYESNEYGGVDGSNNGLVIDTCDIRVPSGQGAGTTGIIVESVDVVIKGGWTSWVETSILSRGGGVKVEGHHFVCDGPIGFLCTNPRNVAIVHCDFDGSGILFDDTAAPIQGWRAISIIGNEHVVASDQTAVLEFKTGDADNFITGLSILGNATIAGAGVTSATKYIDFTDEGAGSWATSWELVIQHAHGAVISFGAIPGKRLITTGRTDLVISSDGQLTLRDFIGTEAEFFFENSANGGSNRPSIVGGGTNGQELLFRNGAGHEIKLSSTGNLQPDTTGIRNLGASTRTWLNGFFNKLTLASITNAADDAAAAAAGVAVGEVYRTGSALKVRAA